MRAVDTDRAVLEEIGFLARSLNRVTVLDTLADGPFERYELEETTGVSRATLGRILDDFSERGWIREVDREYETTHLGTYVAREFVGLMDRFAAVPELNEVAQWFPDEGFDFDIRRLAGAKIVRPTKSNALAPTTHIVRRLQTAHRARVLTYSVLPDAMDACWQATVDGPLEFEGVVDRGTLATLGADPLMVDRARDMLDSGQADIACYPGDVPYTVFVVDDVVLLCLSGGEGTPQAVIETDDEVVRSWAESTIESYRREADPLDVSLFTP